MTPKITFPQLVAALCDATSSDTETATDFMREVFDAITSALAKGENATIKGLGTFMVSENHTIAWIPDEQLAAAVNEPFAFFEAVELGDGVTEETLSAIPPIPGNRENEEEKSPAEKENIASSEDIDTPATGFPADMPPIPGSNSGKEEDTPQQDERNDTPDIPDVSVTEEIVEDVEETVLEENTPQPSISEEPAMSNDEPEENAGTTEEENSYYDNEDEEKPRRKCRLHPCMTFVAGLIIGLAIGYFGAIYAGDHIIESAEALDDASHPDTETIDEAQLSIDQDSLTTEEDADTLTTTHIVEDEPAPYLAIDTVTPNRYLTTMSRQYYGDYRFWVYIYEENKDQITDPDRINPGTTVVIPRKEKYGIDQNDKESLARAERKSREIQAEKRK